MLTRYCFAHLNPSVESFHLDERSCPYCAFFSLPVEGVRTLSLQRNMSSRQSMYEMHNALFTLGITEYIIYS